MMRSTCSAVPALPTPRSRSSVSGAATRVSARTFAYPAAPGIEVTDQIQQARGGGVEVGGQLGDLVAEAAQLRGAASGGSDHGLDAGAKIGVHRQLLCCSSPTLHRNFRALPAPRGQAIGARSAIFRSALVLACLGVGEHHQAGSSQDAGDTRSIVAVNAVK